MLEASEVTVNEKAIIACEQKGAVTIDQYSNNIERKEEGRV